MRVVLIGAGRLATNLAPALAHSGHCIAQVYSRTMASASVLAERHGCAACNRLEQVVDDADVYILAVKDSVLPQLVPSLCQGRVGALFLHTAGSMPLSLFEGHARHYGVLYPMQTFSKERIVDFSRIPVFVEASDDVALQQVTELACSVSGHVRQLSTEHRRYLHLAAVFACNFANHCYALSAQVLEQCGLPFDVMLPLIDETAAKVHGLSPREAQTGPAVRYDENVIQAQSQLLAGNPMMQRVYELMSQSIHTNCSDND